jgi:16S rRNA (cytidine1402-2'-O)-methyltransferase
MSDSLENALYIVSTPIGNLDDITFRAVSVLKNVDLIGAEDTRHSRILLDHYGIDTRMFSLHDHNEQDKKNYIVDQIRQGHSVALISDAGTPLISDPGYHVASYCRELGIRVIPVPGPSAVISALSASGLPTDKFVFGGFLPVKEKALADELQQLVCEVKTYVYYESPRRILDTVRAIVHVLGAERRLVIAREMTKTFESFYDLNAGEMLAYLEEDANRLKGEFVVMIAGCCKKNDGIPAEALNLLKILNEHLPLKTSAAICAEFFHLSKNELYRQGLEEQSSRGD